MNYNSYIKVNIYKNLILLYKYLIKIEKNIYFNKLANRINSYYYNNLIYTFKI